MAYNNRIGVVLKTDEQTGVDYTYRTNVAVKISMVSYFKS